MLLCGIIPESSSKGKDETGKEGGRYRIKKKQVILGTSRMWCEMSPAGSNEEPRRWTIYLTIPICHLLRPAPKDVAPVAWCMDRPNTLL